MICTLIFGFIYDKIIKTDLSYCDGLSGGYMRRALVIEGLKKSYGDVQAVKGIDFDVDAGSLFAFLGENGAGKSTTINMICTLLKKDEGKIKVFDMDIDKDESSIRSQIGVVFQGSVLDKTLTVKQNLTSRAVFYGLYGKAWEDRLSKLSKLLELDDIINRPYGKLSGGQRRRADVARGLINSPKLLILDEPTTGLDPQTRKNVWEIIEKLRKTEGMTVFLTTHYMEEANNADKVVIIDEGRIVAQGSPVQLKNEYSGDYIRLYSKKSQEIEDRLAGFKYKFENDIYRIFVKDSAQAKSFIINNQDILSNFEVIKGDMDDVFLNVTGKKISGGEHK